MHRLESLLGAFNFKKMHLDHYEIPTTKGFIRNAPFNPKTWTIPGDKSGSFKLEELASKETKIYVGGKRKLKRKIVADVVGALVGAFLSTGGEKTALLFMDWIGIKVLGDIIESLAGAILVDSGYNKEVVWQSIRPLLEPLVKELTELCQKRSVLQWW